MDLGTVVTKLLTGQSPTTAAFVADVRLVFANCRAFWMATGMGDQGAAEV